MPAFRSPTVMRYLRSPLAGVMSRVNEDSPYSLPNLAARYDMSLSAGTSSDLVRIDGSNRISLVADSSGNSGVNCLVMGGAASGNFASTPNPASGGSSSIRVTGDIDLRVRVSAVTAALSSATSYALIGKLQTTSTRSYFFELSYAPAGVVGNTALRLTTSTDGTAGAQVAVTSSGGVNAYLTGTPVWFRATRDVDNGSGQNTTAFYYATDEDGTSWNLISTTNTAGTTSIFDSTSKLEIGSLLDGTSENFPGNFFRAQVYNGIGGTLAFDANFNRASKLLSNGNTFTESSANAATVTLSSTGATAARISGARDVFQGTLANQPIYSTSGGLALATFDASNDYLKSAAYAAVQPMTRYTVFKQPTWSSGKILWDGFTAGAAKITQTGSTPNIQLNAGSAGPALATFVLDTWAVCSEIINGASSSMQRNLDAPNSAAAGANATNGTTIGADGGGSNAGALAFAERLSYGVAHDSATRAKVALFLLRKWRANA